MAAEPIGHLLSHTPPVEWSSQFVKSPLHRVSIGDNHLPNKELFQCFKNHLYVHA